jgi:hypothetical protein
VIDTIANVLNKLIHPEVKQKVKKYGKEESETMIQKIFSASVV